MSIIFNDYKFIYCLRIEFGETLLETELEFREYYRKPLRHGRSPRIFGEKKF